VKIIYFGSSAFSVPLLRSVLPFVTCVVTRKAKPKGRGYNLEANEVKSIAAEQGLPVIEIDSFKEEAARELERYKPDFLVVASFGLIVPKWVLEIPSIGPVNVHPSLLPRYRGPAPIQWALWNGEKETGVTFIRMNEKMDEGNILFQERTGIDERDNAVTLSEKLANRAAELLRGFLEGAVRDGLEEGAVQESGAATYTPIVTKEMGQIDWTLGALEATRQVKALVQWPTAYTHLDGSLLKVFDADVHDSVALPDAGLITAVSREGFLVATPNGTVLVREVQIENKKRLSAYQFAQGYRKLAGKRLV
jgi:methionyl-tRNA formyltransferase